MTFELAYRLKRLEKDVKLIYFEDFSHGYLGVYKHKNPETFESTKAFKKSIEVFEELFQ